MATPRKPDPRTQNGHRRRQIRARVKAASDTCAICGQPVDKTLTTLRGQHGPNCKRPNCPGCVPHPMRPEVDEIIPVSRGGNPLDIDNCQLTHRFCNRRKSDKVLTKKVRVSSAVGSVTTSRQW